MSTKENPAVDGGRAPDQDFAGAEINIHNSRFVLPRKRFSAPLVFPDGRNPGPILRLHWPIPEPAAGRRVA